MPIAQTDNLVNENQYLADEENHELKHEYINGYVHAMSGASKNHRTLCGNIFTSLHTHLQNNPCEPSWDARVKAASNYFYPDVVVDCDEDSSADSLYAQKSKIIVEVISRSTRHKDRGAKLLSYINIASLEEYVMVEQEFVSIEVLRKTDGWVPRHYTLGDTIHFESIDCTLSVEQIYHRVDNQDMTEFLAAKT